MGYSSAYSLAEVVRFSGECGIYVNTFPTDLLREKYDYLDEYSFFLYFQ